MNIIFTDYKNDLYTPIHTAVSRGKTEILFSDTEVLFIRDGISGVYFLASHSGADTLRALQAWGSLECPILVTFDSESVVVAKEWFGFTEDMPCHQVIHESGELEGRNYKLKIRDAKESDLDYIVTNYHISSREELLDAIARQELWVGEYDSRVMSFAGRHGEGSMGMLFVDPAYRRMGFSEDLHHFVVSKVLSCGEVPFAHVICGNEPSLQLQRKKNMTFSQGLVYWVY